MVGLLFLFARESLQIALGKISLDDCGGITTLKVDGRARNAVIGPIEVVESIRGFGGESPARSSQAK
jgi:hypothetical protein